MYFAPGSQAGSNSIVIWLGAEADGFSPSAEILPARSDHGLVFDILSERLAQRWPKAKASGTIPAGSTAMDNNRWRVTDIEVPFKCIVWWLLKFWAAQLVLVLTLWICGLLIFGCLTLLGISLLPNHIPSTAPNLHQKYWP